MRNKTKLEMIPLIILSLILSITMVLSMIISIETYSCAQSQINISRANRVGINYILTKLKCNDHLYGIEVKRFNGTDAIYLHQEIDDCTYTTILYVYDGYLRELLCESELIDEFGLSDGEEITPSIKLTAYLKDSVIHMEYTGTSYKKQEISYYIRSGGYYEQED